MNIKQQLSKTPAQHNASASPRVVPNPRIGVVGTQVNGATLLVENLEAQGVTLVAGMPGGAVLPLYDALYHSSIKNILARHEQGAGFIAQGYARATGQVGVCIATSGPGATNLLTALADARVDSIPLIAITGQVPTSLIGTDAFQEADILSMAAAATRAAFQIRDPREIPEIVERAFRIARGGRPGPVLIDIPKDVQLAQVSRASARRTARTIAPAVTFSKPGDPNETNDRQDQIAAALYAAERPILYIGGGVIQSNASHELRRFALQQELPVVSSLMGLGAFDGGHELFYGMLGMHAPRYTNLALQECDLLLAIGARFDDRAAGKAAEFCPGAKVLHIDIDPGEIGKLKAVDIGLVQDARVALAALATKTIPRGRPGWHARLAELRRAYPLSADNQAGAAISFLRELDDRMNADREQGVYDIVTTDVGQHQMWAAQWLTLRASRGFLTSGGLGTMGFGLPAAIGAALARPHARVLCITGDGSILLNLQELATLREIGANVKIILLNNDCLGMVRQQQSLFFGERFSASDFNVAPDFVQLAQSFQIPARRWAFDQAGGLADFLNQPGPALLEVPVDAAETVFPMVPPGKANHEMLGLPRAGSEP